MPDADRIRRSQNRSGAEAAQAPLALQSAPPTRYILRFADCLCFPIPFAPHMLRPNCNSQDSATSYMYVVCEYASTGTYDFTCRIPTCYNGLHTHVRCYQKTGHGTPRHRVRLWLIFAAFHSKYLEHGEARKAASREVLGATPTCGPSRAWARLVPVCLSVSRVFTLIATDGCAPSDVKKSK